MLLRDQILVEAAALVSGGGLTALSIRSVAARCGVSIGAVQHHFPTKSRLLLALVDEVGEEIRAGMGTDFVDRDPYGARRTVGDMAALLGGAHEDSPDHIKVWLAFIAHGVTDQEVARRHQELWVAVEGLFSELIATAGAGLEDAQTRAALLLATLDGLALARALEPARMPLGRCRELIRQAVGTALA